MRKSFKNFLSLLMTLSMVFSMVGVPAMAGDVDSIESSADIDFTEETIGEGEEIIEEIISEEGTTDEETPNEEPSTEEVIFEEVISEAVLLMAAADTSFTENAAPVVITETEDVAQVGNQTYESLQAAINAVNEDESGTIKLLTDHVIDVAEYEKTASGNYDVVCIIGRDITLDLNGKTLTFDYSNKMYEPTIYTSLYVEDGSLTITGNGKIYNKCGSNHRTASIITLDANATVIIENGEFVNDSNEVMFFTGSSSSATEKTQLLIKGGTFTETVKNKTGILFGSSPSNTDKQEIAVSGGTFSHDPTDYCAEGYAPVKDDKGNWTVADVNKTYVAKVGDAKFDTIAAAVEAANEIEGGATVELLDDVTLAEKLTISSNVTISGEHTITRDDAYTGTLFEVSAGAILILNGVTVDGAHPFVLDQEKLNAIINKTASLNANIMDTYPVVVDANKPIAQGYMFINNGSIYLNDVTIQNHSGMRFNGTQRVTGVDVMAFGANASVVMDNSVIKDCVSNNAGAIFNVAKENVSIVMKNGSQITNNFGITSGALVRLQGNNGKFVMEEGSSISNNYCMKDASAGGMGIILSHTTNTLNISDSSIKNNQGTTEYALDLRSASALTMDDNSEISGNNGGIRFKGTSTADLGNSVIGNNGDFNLVFFDNAINEINSDVTVEGPVFVCSSSVTLTISDGQWKCYFDIYGGSTVNITGGTFTQELSVEEGSTLTITGGTFSYDPTEWCAEGYVSKENGDGTWTVSEANSVAKVGDDKFDTLAAAVATANEIEGGATVELLANVTLGEKLTISSNVTISGEHTITRANDYTGTLFAVDAGATLTLDGGLTIDGANEWTLNEELYNKGLKREVTGITWAELITSEENAPNATAAMFVVNGAVVANDVTIQNNYSTKDSNSGDGGVFKVVGADASLTMTGATVKHIVTGGANAVAYLSNATWTINKDTLITDTFAGRNGGICRNDSGLFVMNGGVIEKNNSLNTNGTVIMLYKGSMEMNGGKICSNTGISGTNNGRCAPIYGHSTSTFIMNDGEICHNTGISYGGVDVPSSIKVEINGGYVGENISVLGNTNADVNGNANTVISGGTFTQDVTEWLAPDVGVAYDEETGKYGITEDLYEYNGEAYQTLAEVIAAIKKEQTRSAEAPGVTVLASHKIDKTVVVDTAIVLDLDGKTITAKSLEGTIEDEVYMDAFKILADVTVTGEGTVNAEHGYVFYVGDRDSKVKGNLTIENGTFISGDCTVAQATVGTITVNGGTFQAAEYDGDYRYTLNCDDTNYGNGTASIVVKGGTFYQFNPADNKAEGADTSFVAEGYEVGTPDADGWYTVKTFDYVKWVQAELLAGNDVTLDRDIVITDYELVHAHEWPSNGNGKYNEVHGNGAIFHIIKPGVVLDLNGHSITWDAHHDDYCNKRQVSLFMVTATGVAGETADFTVIDTSENKTGKVDVYGMGTGMYSVLATAKATIDGGTWTNYPCKTCGASNIFIYPSHGATLEITGGTFEQKDSEYLLGWKGSTKETTDNGVGVDYDQTKVVISGGTFVNFNPEEVKFFDTASSGKETVDGCALGLMAKDNKDGTFGVKEWDLVIRDTDDMLRFAAMVNGGNNFADKIVKLGDDIDLAGIEWSPIGGDSVYFAGEFDGQKYTISNLTQTKGARMGLFGLVEKAYIHDLTMEKVSFTIGEDSARVGAIAGNLQNWNVLENITIDGITVIANGKDGLIGSVAGYVWKSQLGNVDVKNAVYTVNGTGNVIGGHTGYGRAHVWDKDVTGNNTHWLDGTVQDIDGTEYVLQNYFVDCDVDGIKITLNGTGSEVGGFFGSDTYNSHSNYFVNCHVTDLDVTAVEGTSQTVGGFIAWNNGTTSAGTVKGFDRCSAAGTINGANGIYGGFAGQVGGRACEYYNATADVDITSTGTAGGFVGATQAYSTHKYTFTNCTASGDVSGTVAGGFVGKNGMSGDGKSVFVELNNCSASGKVAGTDISGGLIGEVTTELPATNWNTVDSTGSLALIDNVASAKENVTGGTTVGYLIGYFDGVANGDAGEGNTVELTLNGNTPDGSDIGIGTGHHINISSDTIIEDIVKYVAQIGETPYKTLAEAITAAQSGDTIIFLSDITENVTVSKNVTIDGDGKKYTGNITVNNSETNNVEVTVKNINFVDYADSYAIKTNTIKSITVENCTVTNYDWGFLYANKSTPNVVVKDVTVDGGNYGFHWAYGTSATLENVTMTGVTYGIVTQNYGAKTITLTNCSISGTNPIYVVERNATVTDTFKFEGYNELTALPISQYAKVVAEAVVEGTDIVKIGDLAPVVAKAADGDTVKLLSDVDITDAEYVRLDGDYNTLVKVEDKSITVDMNSKTISGEYAVDSLMLVGVFSTENNGHLTLTGNGTVDITTAEDSTTYALIVNYEDDCSITIENGTYKLNKASDSLIFTDGNEGVIVNGGTFTLGNIGTGSNGSPWIFNAKGQNTSHVVVTGGTFNADIVHQYYPFEVFMDRSLALQKNDADTTWTVVPAVAYVNEQEWSSAWYTNEVGYATLAEAIDAVDEPRTKSGKTSAQEVVTLLANCIDDVVVSKEVTIVKDVWAANYITAGEGFTKTEDREKIVITLIDAVANVVKADGTTVPYASVSEALAAAKSGETVVMIDDSEETVAMIMVPYGYTLDLNGHNLTAPYVASFGEIIDGEDGGHGAIITNDLIANTNEYLPVYDSSVVGYRFYKFELVNLGGKRIAGNELDGMKYGVRILFNNMEAYNVINTTSDFQFEIMYEIAWGNMEKPHKIALKQSTIRSFGQAAYQDYSDGQTNVTKAMTISVTGIAKLPEGTEISANWSLKSGVLVNEYTATPVQ